MPYVCRGNEVAHMDCMYRADAVARDTPWTREMCELLPRPCPVTECRYHWAQNPCRAYNQPSHEGVRVGCYLDWIDEHPGGDTLEAVGDLMGVTRERVRQIQETALRNFRIECRRQGLSWRDFCHAAGLLDAGATPLMTQGQRR